MQMRTVLLRRFPHVFRPFNELKTPFKIGIVEDIKAAAPELELHVIRWAVRDYVMGRTYHQVAMVPGTMRLDLNGEPAGEVTKSQAGFHARHFHRITQRNAMRNAPKAAEVPAV